MIACDVAMPHPDRSFDSIAVAAHDVCRGLASLCCGSCAWMPADPRAGGELADLMGALAGSQDGGAVAEKDGPLVARTLWADDDGRLRVWPLRAWLAGHEGAFTAVWNAGATPYLCRPLQRGADVTVEDLRAWTPPALLEAAGFDPRGAEPLPVVVARGDAARRRWDAWAAEALPEACSGAGRPCDDPARALLAGGLATLSLVVQRRCDTALALAHYLAAHPRVAWVSYPGLEGDPANDAARRTLEHGFGPQVAFGLDCPAEVEYVTDVGFAGTPCAGSAWRAFGSPAACGVLCGLESPLDVVGAVDAALATCGPLPPGGAGR
jgi:hypothetical protein